MSANGKLRKTLERNSKSEALSKTNSRFCFICLRRETTFLDGMARRLYSPGEGKSFQFAREAVQLMFLRSFQASPARSQKASSTRFRSLFSRMTRKQIQEQQLPRVEVEEKKSGKKTQNQIRLMVEKMFILFRLRFLAFCFHPLLVSNGISRQFTMSETIIEGEWNPRD